MLSLIQRPWARSSVAVLLIVFMFSLGVPMVFADGPRSSDKDAAADASSSTSHTTDRKEVVLPKSELKIPRVMYAAFDGAMNVRSDAAPEAAARPRSVTRLIASINGTAKPLPPPPPAASTAPMTVGEKFGAWFHSRFLSPGAYGAAVASGMWKELQDNDDFKKDTVENFFADSMTRAARSYAFGATAGFYEKAVLASLFRQDPRYHRSDKKGAGAKIGYAVTRVFVTQGDRCGCDQFNASFLLGGAAAAVTANLWERRERTGPRHTISRFYNHIAITAFFNIVKEFVGGQ